jgi:hypothetical protein
LEKFTIIFSSQYEGLTHDHGLIWVKDVLQFYISMNEKNEKFVEKYLTTNRFFLPRDIRKAQIHQHKQTCKEKCNKFVDFNILNHQCDAQKYCYL